MNESSTPPVRDCGRYTPGHTIHWIQARLTWNRPVAPTAVEIIEVGETYVLLSADDGVRRFWNHDLDRLRAAVAENGPRGALVGHHVLRLEAGQLFCLKEDSEGPLDPCVEPY